MMAVGYGVRAYRDSSDAREASRLRQREMAEAQEAERRREVTAMLDAYGDRTSTAALEDAIRLYEARKEAE